MENTVSNLRKLERRHRIARGKRPAKYPLFGKRWATICKKRAAKAAK